MAYVDLTHPFGPGAFTVGRLPSPVIERMWCLPEDPANLTRVETIVHCGTHLDAPCHFAADGVAIDELPLGCASGMAVGWRVRVAPDAAITVDDLRRNATPIKRGDLVFLDTGWGRHYDDHERYAEHPRLSEDAAHWLVGQGIRLLAVDLPTPDLAGPARPANFDWPVHRTLLGSGVLIAENLANLERVAGRRFTALGFPIPIVGSDGAPTRFVAEL